LEYVAFAIHLKPAPGLPFGVPNSRFAEGTSSSVSSTVFHF
jgi:hypothetical protein